MTAWPRYCHLALDTAIPLFGLAGSVLSRRARPYIESRFSFDCVIVNAPDCYRFLVLCVQERFISHLPNRILSQEMKSPVPTEPFWFLKPPSSYLASGGKVQPPSYQTKGVKNCVQKTDMAAIRHNISRSHSGGARGADRSPGGPGFDPPRGGAGRRDWKRACPARQEPDPCRCAPAPPTPAGADPLPSSRACCPSGLRSGRSEGVSEVVFFASMPSSSIPPTTNTAWS